MKRFYLFAAALSVLVACEKNNGTDDEPQDNNFEEFEDHFVYYGESYNIVTLKNGATWMAENLRYVPEGKTVSDDPKSDACIWYPYEVTDGAAVVLKDEASIKEKGYLYDMKTAFGVELNDDNFKTFEGTQGICPKGWHIPTRADWLALVGYSLKADGEEDAVEKSDAIFYEQSYKGAKILSLVDAQGLNLKLTGYVNRKKFDSTDGSYSTKPVLSETNTTLSSLYGVPALTYYMSSTGRSSYSGDNVYLGYQYFAIQTTFSKSLYPEGRVHVGYAQLGNGMPLRCVKDAE